MSPPIPPDPPYPPAPSALPDLPEAADSAELMAGDDAGPGQRRSRHSADLPTQELEGVDESTWVDVIRKMDEVYSQLIEDEIELERKNVQLEQTQQFVYSVLTAMTDVLIVCGADGQIEETNAALCELVGRSDADLRGVPVFQLFADERSIAGLQRLIGHADPARMGEVLELNLVDATGKAVPIDASCTPRLSPDGRRAGTVVVGRPMAEIKQAYGELRRAHEALQRAQQQLVHSEKMASLGRLVAGVAHELNNPISFVLGNVHALQRYSARLEQYLTAVHADEPATVLADLRARLRIDHVLADLPSLIDGTLEGARRTTDIVNGLKRFSAMDTQVRQPVDLNEVVDRAVLWIRRGKLPAFELHWPRQPVALVAGSAGQLQQVVMNLLQNALDGAQAEPGKGAGIGRGMAVAAPSTRRPLEIWVDLVDAGGQVELRLRDNGPGIAAVHLNRIFDPFFTTKAVGKGTGLGLSISYGIVEQHGGHLGVRNHPDGGAEFLIQLPGLDDELPPADR